jgi:hypothetical protein
VVVDDNNDNNEVYNNEVVPEAHVGVDVDKGWPIEQDEVVPDADVPQELVVDLGQPVEQEDMC